MSSIKRVVFWVSAIILAFLLAAAVVYSQEQDPQVILIVDGAENGKMYVIPKSQVYFAIVPMPETHPAPLEKGAYMICREHDIHFSDGSLHVAFKCGADDYVIQGLGIVKEK